MTPSIYGPPNGVMISRIIPPRRVKVVDTGTGRLIGVGATRAENMLGGQVVTISVVTDGGDRVMVPPGWLLDLPAADNVIAFPAAGQGRIRAC